MSSYPPPTPPGSRPVRRRGGEDYWRSSDFNNNMSSNSSHFDAEESVLAVLARESGAVTLSDLQKESGLSARQLGEYVSLLDDRGLIEYTRVGSETAVALKGKVA